MPKVMIKIWETPGYPKRFVIDGIEFWLVVETKWLRTFRSNAKDKYLRNLSISRITDGSTAKIEAETQLNRDDLEEAERRRIKMALLLGSGTEK